MSTTVEAPILRPLTPSEDSDVLDVVAELRAAVADLRRTPVAAISAELTMSQKSARSRGLWAVVSTIAAIVYALIDVLHDKRQDTDTVDRVERVEAAQVELSEKVDAVAKDVATIAEALE